MPATDHPRRPDMKEVLNVHVIEAQASHAEPAPTVVFAHGYGCDQGMWADVTPGLPQAHRVLFDWPGAGGADPGAYDPECHATLEGYADDLLALLADLRAAAPVVVGHSVGASVAMLAARRRPAAFGSLVLLCPSPCFANDPPHYQGGFERAQLAGLVDSLAQGLQAWARAIAPVAMGNAEQPAFTQRLADSFCAMDPEVALRWARATFLADIRAEVPLVDVPALVLQSRRDDLAPMSVGVWLAASLPQGTLQVMETQGHCPHVSAPAVVVDALLGWLARRP